MDLAAGPGVDVVLNDPTRFPFADAQFDTVVSSSCLEHDPMFWITFLEMVRVLKEGGYLYVNVPSNGEFHRYPTDNWRFYPDSALALLKWARRQNYYVFLVEAFVARRSADQWNDCVMVFRKDIPAAAGQQRIVDTLPNPYNIHRGEDGAIENQSRLTEDMALLTQARADLASRDAEIARLTAELSRLRDAATPEPAWIGFDC
jgi:SAM-dependent methyltransferase